MFYISYYLYSRLNPTLLRKLVIASTTLQYRKVTPGKRLPSTFKEKQKGNFRVAAVPAIELKSVMGTVHA